MIIRSEWIVRGAIRVFRVPICSETGGIRCCGYWHWNRSLELLHPGQPSWAERYARMLNPPPPSFDEYSRVGEPYDPRRLRSCPDD